MSGTIRIVTIPAEELQQIIRDEVRAALEEAGGGPRQARGYMSVRQAAEHAGCSEETIREWIASGKLPRRRVGAGRGHYRVSVVDLERAMQPPEPARFDPDAAAVEILSRRRSGG